MLKKILIMTGVIFSCGLLFVAGCGKETPNRDHIPLIKKSLFRLQTGVKEQNLALIDSVLSPKILDKSQSSDSLLKYVYGPGNTFSFEQFGNAEMTYLMEKGRIDCYLMDSTHMSDRPFVLFLALEHDMWLFTSFAPGKIEQDSLITE